MISWFCFPHVQCKHPISMILFQGWCMYLVLGTLLCCVHLNFCCVHILFVFSFMFFLLVNYQGYNFYVYFLVAYKSNGNNINFGGSFLLFSFYFQFILMLQSGEHVDGVVPFQIWICVVASEEWCMPLPIGHILLIDEFFFLLYFIITQLLLYLHMN